MVLQDARGWQAVCLSDVRIEADRFHKIDWAARRSVVTGKVVIAVSAVWVAWWQQAFAKHQTLRRIGG